MRVVNCPVSCRKHPTCLMKRTTETYKPNSGPWTWKHRRTWKDYGPLTQPKHKLPRLWKRRKWKKPVLKTTGTCVDGLQWSRLLLKPYGHKNNTTTQSYVPWSYKGTKHCTTPGMIRKCKTKSGNSTTPNGQPLLTNKRKLRKDSLMSHVNGWLLPTNQTNNAVSRK